MLESQFDGLVGPTHHYAGQSFGNQASMANANALSNPRAAALQGLKKTAFVRDLGIPQGLLPPVRRPRLEPLHRLGYRGSEGEILEKAYRDSPTLVSAMYSASSMWVANSSTFSPSIDTLDGRAHFTAANLSSKVHRGLEAPRTAATLKQIFKGDLFVHHDPVDSLFGDEGAANHGRLARAHGQSGLELFFYGKNAVGSSPSDPKKYPARQSREASEAIARIHGVKEAVYLKQSAEAIDAGVFHNDVISVANESVYLFHEKTFVDHGAALAEIKAATSRLGIDLELLEVKAEHLALSDAVASYLFNSQLLTLPSGKMVLIAPEECKAIPSVEREITRLCGESLYLNEAHYFDLKESMRNGGGPACLRLRVLLTPEEKAAVNPLSWLTPDQENILHVTISTHYRDRLILDDLRSLEFYRESMAVFDRLEEIFGVKLD